MTTRTTTEAAAPAPHDVDPDHPEHEHPAPSGAGPGLRERLRRVSVRTRIATSVSLLAAFSLTAAGVLVYSLELNRMRASASASVAQELQELQVLNSDGRDPRTNEPFTSSQRLLRIFLERNVPDEDEFFVTWIDGEAETISSNTGFQPVIQEPAFRETVTGLLREGGTVARASEQFGDHYLAVQPVGARSSGQPDALVVMKFLDDERQELFQTMRTYAAVALVLLLLITAAAWLQAGRLLRPLRALRENAAEMSASDFSRRLEEPASQDDIGQLTRTYNAMLDRMEHGFGAQRQFLDDAGHELRTPLTVLRGHLELVDPHDPADVRKTGDLLLDEVDRMSRLVDELILLAKSNRPDFVRRAEVGVADLVEQVHRKAGALDSSRTWRIGELPPRGVAVLLDEQRLTQALLQLCDNAVKHTGPGDSITLAAREVPGAVRLSVTDTGTGVAAEAHERIFERFGRDQVPEGDEGFGLGLSIVRAIAEAHDASVHVEDGPGGGARFVITIPHQEGPTPWPES